MRSHAVVVVSLNTHKVVKVHRKTVIQNKCDIHVDLLTLIISQLNPESNWVIINGGCAHQEMTGNTRKWTKKIKEGEGDCLENVILI